MVFDQQAPPPDRKGFMAWYAQQTRWEEDHGYEDPEVTTPELRAWFLEMVRLYPAMNGPFASGDVDHPKVSDYCIGKRLVYVGFAWSQAKEAYETVLSRARKHKVGFFDVSADDGAVWVPGPAGTYKCIHGGARWWRFWK